jgi:hypothetical protein
MENFTEKNKFYGFFKNLCTKRMCKYRVRGSQTSRYIELDVRNKTYLFRFSDHPYSSNHPWTPDFDVIDRETFKNAKKFLKMHNRRIDNV